MKKKSIIIGTLAVLIILFFSANQIAAYYLNQQLSNSPINESLQYRKLSVNLLQRKIAVKSLTYSKNGIEFKAEKVTAKGIQVIEIIKNKNLIINKLILKSPNLTYKKVPKSETKKSASKKSKIASFWLKNLEIEDGIVILKDSLNNTTNSLYGIEIALAKIDQSVFENKNPKLIGNYLKELSIDSVHSKSVKFHNLTTKDIHINDGHTSVNSIAIQPIEEFHNGDKKPKHVVTWMDLTIKSLNFSLDFNAFEKNFINIPSMEVEEVDAKLSTNQNYPKPKGFSPKMPNEMILGIGMPFKVDELEIKNSDLKYSETANGATEQGYITLNQFYATLKNITNDSATLIKDKMMRASVQTDLMNHKKLTVNITYDLQSENGDHTIKANLKDYDMTKLNVAFEPLANVIFETGRLNSLDFNFNANKFSSTGDADFYYEDLKIVMKAKEKSDRPKFLNKIETIIANGLIVRKANPLRGNYVQGKVDFKRNTNKSFLNYWWSSCFSGMKSTMVRVDQ